MSAQRGRRPSSISLMQRVLYSVGTGVSMLYQGGWEFGSSLGDDSLLLKAADKTMGDARRKKVGDLQRIISKEHSRP